ncbi:hypothetical protein K1719_034683 [Acacia pycnantha]|nr:hypothetical protein K1719_034683 [Acacia pycnantha]
MVSRHIIHIVEVLANGVRLGVLTCVYGPVELSQEGIWWIDLRELKHEDGIQWAIVGDFNDLLYHSDKKGGRLNAERDLVCFLMFMIDYAMAEIETKGRKFTWMDNKDRVDFIREKLDEVVGNCAWRLNFTKGRTDVLNIIVATMWG